MTGAFNISFTQKILLPCNCCCDLCASPEIPHYLKTGWETQKVAHRRQRKGRITAMVAQGSSWSSNGGTVAVTLIAQCTLLEAQRGQRGGTREAEAKPRLSERALQENVFKTWRQWTDHCASNGSIDKIMFARGRQKYHRLCVKGVLLTIMASTNHIFDRQLQFQALA